jgi:hypothetical protein
MSAYKLKLYCPLTDITQPSGKYGFSSLLLYYSSAEQKILAVQINQLIFLLLFKFSPESFSRYFAIHHNIIKNLFNTYSTIHSQLTN